MAEDKVVYVSEDVTLHSVLGSEQVNGNTVYNVESVSLKTGDTFDFNKLPPYQQESVEAGTVPGVEVVSAKKAEELSKARSDFLKSIGAGEPDVNFQTVGFTGPDADDGSFSDHEVSDAERVANHAARAKAEAGEAGPSDEKVTVVGADSEDSPANDGRTTGSSDVAEEVQGSGAKEASSKSTSKSNK